MLWSFLRGVSIIKRWKVNSSNTIWNKSGQVNAEPTTINGNKILRNYCMQNNLEIPEIQYSSTAGLYNAKIELLIPKFRITLYSNESGNTLNEAGSVSLKSIIGQLSDLDEIERVAHLFEPKNKHFSSTTKRHEEWNENLRSVSVNSKGSSNLQETAKLSRKNAELTADDHGGWNLNNCRNKLNAYCQQNNLISPAIRLTKVKNGSHHNPSFNAATDLYVPSVQQTIHASEIGRTKSMAKAMVSLSLVQQLYQTGEIGDVSTSKKSKTHFDPIELNLTASVRQQLHDAVQNPSIEFDDNLNVSITDLANIGRETSCIDWCPPMAMFNPWSGMGLPDTLSLNEISDNITAIENYRNVHPNIEAIRHRLPIFKSRCELLDVIRDNKVVIVKGATGSGKTTQLPQYILENAIENNRGGNCSVIVTQPRKIAAVSIAKTVAKERGEKLGSSVGYHVRFESVFPRSHGSIMFCTVGLRGVSHIVVDEVHERDLNTDFLLAILRDMSLVFPELRIILMSATIDTSIFSKYFNNAPIVHVSGRSFPVQQYFLDDIVKLVNLTPTFIPSKKQNYKTNLPLRIEEELMKNYESPNSGKTTLPLYELIDRLLVYIKNMNIEGSILIFLPGWHSISSMKHHLEHSNRYSSERYRILPLHSNVSLEDRDRIFDASPTGMTKIILSTNIAETSITIPDVSFVIDSCTAKMVTSIGTTKKFKTAYASKSNLKQRTGRAGRVRDGYCFNLITQSRLESLDNEIMPEILRTPLYSTALTIKQLGLGNIKEFLGKTITPPKLHNVMKTETLLKEYNALSPTGEITSLGRILSQLPLDIQLGRMVVWGCCFDVADHMCTLAAALCLNEPFVSETLNRYDIDRNGELLFSDHINLIYAFDAWEEAWNKESWCQEHKINMLTMRSIKKIKQQIKSIMLDFNFPKEILSKNLLGDDHMNVLKTIIALTLNNNVAVHQKDTKIIIDGKRARIHNTSVNYSRGSPDVQLPGPLLVYGERMVTKFVVSTRQTTFIAPSQLILSSRDVVQVKDSTLVVNGWIPMLSNAADTTNICTLRTMLERLLIKVASNPELSYSMIAEDKKLIEIATKLNC